MSLLEVSDLRVSFGTADGVVKAVRGVSFSVDTGRTLGIVGESGSGKTVLTQTLLGLAPGGQVFVSRPCSTARTCSALPPQISCARSGARRSRSSSRTR